MTTHRMLQPHQHQRPHHCSSDKYREDHHYRQNSHNTFRRSQSDRNCSGSTNRRPTHDDDDAAVAKKIAGGTVESNAEFRQATVFLRNFHRAETIMTVIREEEGDNFPAAGKLSKKQAVHCLASLASNCSATQSPSHQYQEGRHDRMPSSSPCYPSLAGDAPILQDDNGGEWGFFSTPSVALSDAGDAAAQRELSHLQRRRHLKRSRRHYHSQHLWPGQKAAY